LCWKGNSSEFKSILKEKNEDFNHLQEGIIIETNKKQASGIFYPDEY